MNEMNNQVVLEAMLISDCFTKLKMTQVRNDAQNNGF